MAYPATEYRHTCPACGWTRAYRGDVIIELSTCPSCDREGVEMSSRSLLKWPSGKGAPVRDAAGGWLDQIKRLFDR